MPELQDGCLFQPLVSLMQGKELLPTEKGYLKSVVSGGQWPQHRQWSTGMTDSPVCLACRQNPCTLRHRHTACGMQEEVMEAKDIPSYLGPLSRAAAASPLTNLFAERLLVPAAVLPASTKPPERWFGG
eukprot:6333726-Pyramimonas_sp.AAC.1